MARLSRTMRVSAALLAFSLLAIGAAPAPDVQFTDITQATGIDFKHENSATSSKYLIETMGGGVAPAGLRQRRPPRHVLHERREDRRSRCRTANGPTSPTARFWNRLYRQNEDGTFVDVTAKAGLTGMPQNHYGMGIAVGDYDNDGFTDLYVTNYGGNTLYRNNGDGTFADVTRSAGVGAGGWSASAGFFDADNDGRLDLFVTRYLDWTLPEPTAIAGRRSPVTAPTVIPTTSTGSPTSCIATTATGHSRTSPSKAGVADANGKGLGVAFADYDDDGFVDVYVANDSVQSFLYRNKGKSTFAEVGLLTGVGFNEDGKTFAGMGVDFADYDNDGHPDIVVTDLSNERYRLFRQNADRSFRDVTNMSGVGGATLPFSGWSTRFFDYDNDGWKDIFVAQGHVMDTIEKTAPNLKYQQPPLLLRNEAGRFVRVLPGDSFQKDWAGRGAAFGDLDNDGDIDVVASNVGQKAFVLRNDGGNRGNWLAIRTIGKTSNRDGIGCRVKVVSASGVDSALHRQHGCRLSLGQ